MDAKIEEARFLAAKIPHAELIELEGNDHIPWVGDADTLLDEVEMFVTGQLITHQPERILATLLFTDIVGSTEMATSLGDKRWHELLKQHHNMIRRELTRFRGKEITTTGDGFLATFDGPGRAISCAVAISNALKKIGITIRAGLHTGEIELMENDNIGGIAVHLCSRVMSKAEDGEVLITSTVKDLVAGAGFHFTGKGKHVLKGITGEWELYSVMN
jgi:class 3 adenylate cyclase